MKNKLLYILGGIVVLIAVVSISDSNTTKDITQATTQVVPVSNTLNAEKEGILNTTNKASVQTESSPSSYYTVTRVVDGDTIKVSINGSEETLRLIGMDTPETVDPRKEVQCFGVEASNKAKALLTGKKVKIETDASQGTYDKYNRHLAYIFLEDGTFYNKYMIEQGYAHEYTYGTPYKYQTEFKNAQKSAQSSKLGFWASNTCNGNTTTPAKATATITSTQTGGSSGSCTIKGNISSTKEKIYHMVGCGSYIKTVIDETAGEKWFCSEDEAVKAGWRKAGNCS